MKRKGERGSSYLGQELPNSLDFFLSAKGGMYEL